MNDDERGFWMVWCPNGGAPNVKHDFDEQAHREAERLAREHPGRKFYVLLAKSYYVKRDCSRVDLAPPDNIPF